ncbi:Transmembrane51B [Apis cerana cerana]|uniref:Transmembrane51B n=1 Tax=Apis cerana cerana TaxID=94128 RepID=A0A2A3ESD6_APICC|nr:Transmembrane51B [Apis cerana cerana]
MNRENEEQRPVSQTLCGVLQKEPNCKCLVLSVLIYGCLAAVTWCRCANVTKVAFMGMLYLVYLVECYHSPIRIDLLHAESQDSVLSKITQLKLAQPTIWWKAVSYHYVRRKRQITRYRNGDNYTTTQVYYERINTHAATSFYYYDYCGVKDISKELILDPKVPITKINLSKGFAFSNMRSATEFEEARSRFFAEQELRDDYMEMREGLDLGYNPNPTTLVAVLGNPWFTNRYVYWCLSALLLSWPLRVIIEYKTQYADYQITKLFGINYDTPSGCEPIHASMSQQTINQPGSYMLAPSYSEALLMDPAPDHRPSSTEAQQEEQQSEAITEMVPSYSEALLYRRADQGCVLEDSNRPTTGGETGDTTASGKCASCGKYLVEARLETAEMWSRSECTISGWSWGSRRGFQSVRRGPRTMATAVTMPRDMSEPNLRSRSDSLEADTRFLRLNGQSLRNILESEQEEEFGGVEDGMGGTDGRGEVVGGREEGKFRLSLCSLDETNSRPARMDASRGAIPKRICARSRVIANPMSDEGDGFAADTNAYFCLKSILKNKRRMHID